MMSSSTWSTGVSMPRNSVTSSGISRPAPNAARSSRICAAFAPRRSCSIAASRRPRPGRSCRRRSPPSRAPKARVSVGCPTRAEPGRCGWAPAAALILATVIGLLPLLNRNATPTTTAPAAAATTDEITVESVTAEFGKPEEHYQKAIDDLQTIANKDTGELDPQVAAVLQKNLTVIDQAITRKPRRAQVPAVEHQRAERPVRRAAHQGRAAAADRRIDQRDAQGQSSRSGPTGPDAVAIAAYADQTAWLRDVRRWHPGRRTRRRGGGDAARPRPRRRPARQWFERYQRIAAGSRADRQGHADHQGRRRRDRSMCRIWPATFA